MLRGEMCTFTTIIRDRRKIYFFFVVFFAFLAGAFFFFVAMDRSPSFLRGIGSEP